AQIEPRNRQYLLRLQVSLRFLLAFSPIRPPASSLSFSFLSGIFENYFNCFYTESAVAVRFAFDGSGATRSS
ncbi:hypothetical protein Gohar_006241, partial [Gossypium harknessii]|nr:hypothetical protein [Gossypium harknessii]